MILESNRFCKTFIAQTFKTKAVIQNRSGSLKSSLSRYVNSEKSLVKIKNREGAKLESWGTPLGAALAVEKVPIVSNEITTTRQTG